MAGFISEWWPASNRNGGRDEIGIPGRLASEFAAGIAAQAAPTLLGLMPGVAAVFLLIGGVLSFKAYGRE